MENQSLTRSLSATVHANIRRRLTLLGISPETASKAGGLDPSYIKKLLARPNSVPGTDTMQKLAQGLQTTSEWMTAHHDDADAVGTDAGSAVAVASIVAPAAEPESAVPPQSGIVPEPRARDFRPAEVDLPPRLALPSDVPVYGTVAGSLAKGAFLFEGGVIEFVRRPPALMGSKAVYALYVEGSSMTPEHNPGDLRFIHTTRPPRVGDSVAVQVQSSPEGDVEGYIGHFVRKTPTSLIIGKLNPRAEVAIKLDYVKAVHKVLTVNELFGV